MRIPVAGIIRIAILTGTAVIASCTQAEESSRPSILPTLTAMEPVLACIDGALLDPSPKLNECFEKAGISLVRPSNEPKTAADFKSLVIGFWLQLDRDPNHPLRIESFPKGLDYAACVETAAYADKAFSSRTEKGVWEAQSRAEDACKSHPLSIRGLKPDEAAATADIADRLYAKALANLAMTYALEANGWYPDEMRPCIRYLDGRPPSAGCAGKPEPHAPPPPSARSAPPQLIHEGNVR